MIEGCDRTVQRRGWCLSHYRRWRQHGDPLATPIQTRGALAHLEAIVLACILTRSNECVLMPYSPRTPYVSLYYQGRRWRHHEVVLLLTGRIPPGSGGHTRHLCGQSKCANPHHIVIGTAKQNSEDSVAHGVIPRGEQRWNAILTADDVRVIRATDDNQRITAEEFGVSGSTISAIRRRKTWKHIT